MWGINQYTRWVNTMDQWEINGNIASVIHVGGKSSNAIGSSCSRNGVKIIKNAQACVWWPTNVHQNRKRSKIRKQKQAINIRNSNFCPTHSQCLWSFIRWVDGEHRTMGDRSFWFFEQREQCNLMIDHKMIFKSGEKLIRTHQRLRTLWTHKQRHISPTVLSSWHKKLIDTCKTFCQTS